MILNGEDIKPCGYQVLVRMLKVENKSQGGILLTDEYVNREQAAMPVGQIVAFGTACYKNQQSGVDKPQDWGVQDGDYVQFPSHAYMKVAGDREDGESLVYVLDYDIKGKVSREALIREGMIHE